MDTPTVLLYDFVLASISQCQVQVVICFVPPSASSEWIQSHIETARRLMRTRMETLPVKYITTDRKSGRFFSTEENYYEKTFIFYGEKFSWNMAGNIMVWKFIKMSRNSAKHSEIIWEKKPGLCTWHHGKQKVLNGERLIKFRPQYILNWVRVHWETPVKGHWLFIVENELKAGAQLLAVEAVLKDQQLVLAI